MRLSWQTRVNNYSNMTSRIHTHWQGSSCEYDLDDDDDNNNDDADDDDDDDNNDDDDYDDAIAQ